MKQYSEEEKQYFRKHIKEFTLKEKSELIDSNLKDIIIDDLINICKYWPDKEIRLKAKKLLNINLITKDNFITNK